MSTTQFKDDLTRNSPVEESRSSSNAGMNLALMLTLAFSLIIILWAVMAAPHTNYGSIKRPVDAANSSVEQTHVRYKTTAGSKVVSTDDDKSNAAGTQVQGDTLVPGFSK